MAMMTGASSTTFGLLSQSFWRKSYVHPDEQAPISTCLPQRQNADSVTLWPGIKL